MATYKVFTRNWWKSNPAWPNGLEPDASGQKKTLRRGLTLKEARAFCEEYNRNNKPGKLSRKAEFTEE